MTGPTPHHVTVATGHVAMTPRSHVADEAVAHVRAVLGDAGDGIEPTTGWRIRVTGAATGRGTFLIARPDGGGLELVRASLCWRADWSDEHWRKAVAPTAERAPVPTPWLAVSVDYTQMLDMSDDQAQALGDLERVTAWAIIEALS